MLSVNKDLKLDLPIYIPKACQKQAVDVKMFSINLCKP